MVSSTERRDEALHVLPSPKGEARHLQSRDPPLGPALQDRYLSSRKGQGHRLIEELLGLDAGEAQIFRADFRDSVLRPQARERERRIRAGRDEDAQ